MDKEKVFNILNGIYYINIYNDYIYLKPKKSETTYTKKVIKKNIWNDLLLNVNNEKINNTTSDAEKLLIEIINRRNSFEHPKKIEAFYHIAAMNDWKSVVLEQKKIMDAVDIKPKCCVIGDKEDVEWIEKQGLEIIQQEKDLKEYEIPTLEKIYNYSLNNKEDAILYFHVKGVSTKKNDSLYDTKKMWRWIMMEYLVSKWKYHIKDLVTYDAVGVDWQSSNTLPHFAGNFWMARADWISLLRSPRQYKEFPHHPPRHEPEFGNPWARMSAESWLGSEQWHIIKSLGSRNGCIAGSFCPFYEPYRSKSDPSKIGISDEEAIEYILKSDRFKSII